VRIAPSILSADFGALAASVDGVAAEADLLHVDVMDGHFVPNLTIGPPVVSSLRRHTDLYLDCHLMMDNPSDFLEAFARAGASGCTVHAEIDGVDDLVTQMRELGLDVGVAANPDTPFKAVAPFLADIDLLLLMTVFPGFAGQAFMPEVVPKIAEAHAEIERQRLPVAIEVDGGIDEETAPVVAAAGATVLVAGNAIFGNEDPLAAAGRIRKAADAAVGRR
jgi:ribulose-phosphate 3-epimerase